MKADSLDSLAAEAKCTLYSLDAQSIHIQLAKKLSNATGDAQLGLSRLKMIENECIKIRP